MAQYVLLPHGGLLPVAVALVIATLAGLAFRGKWRLRIVLATGFAVVGVIWSFGHYQLFIAPAERLAGTQAALSARVTDYPEKGENSYSVNILPLTDGVPRVKCRLYSYDDISSLRPGDVIETTATFTSALTWRGEDTDYNTSRGIFAVAYAKGEVAVTGSWPGAFLYFPKTLSQALKAGIDNCWPADTAGFIKAIVTGDKSTLSEDAALYGAMGTAGLMHVVAVSGMHISFLLGLIQTLTGRRGRAAFIAVPIIVVFAAMTGGNPSVVRAGFMQVLLLLAPTLRRESDAITSISAVLALLLAVNPASAASVSLQLSFAAMAGIILITPRVYAWFGLKRSKSASAAAKATGKLKRYALASLSSTIGALAFSTPLTALHFGYVALFSPLTNLLCLWAVSLCFSLGILIAFLGPAIPAAAACAAWVVSWPARYVFTVVTIIAKIPFAALYTVNNIAGWWLAFAYVIFIGTYLAKGKGKFNPILPICMTVTSLCVVMLLTFWTLSPVGGSAKAKIIVLDVGQGQCIAVLTEDSAVLIDCGSSGSSSAAASAASEVLAANGISRVDMLILTHFHADHANGAARLIAALDVERVVMPEENFDEDSDSIYNKIVSAAGEAGTELIYITEDSVISADGVEYYIWAPMGNYEENERGLIIMADFGEFEAVVTGDVNSYTERRLIRKAEFPDTELLVAGHHGSKYSTCEELIAALNPELAVISVGYNTYGHPSQEALDRLQAHGMEIYRTDISGNITIEVG